MKSKRASATNSDQKTSFTNNTKCKMDIHVEVSDFDEKTGEVGKHIISYQLDRNQLSQLKKVLQIMFNSGSYTLITNLRPEYKSSFTKGVKCK